MATLQNAIQVSNNLPQVINNFPQVINNSPQVDGNLTRISNGTLPNIDARSIKIQLTQINMLYTQMEQEIQKVDQTQGKLNERLRKGAAVIDAMVNKFKGLVANMLNFENLKVVISLSDDMASTQGRLELMNSEYQKQAQAAGVVNTALTSTSALQDMIFDSAQRTFSSYQTTADMVTRLGADASNAFSSPAEIVAFTEQMNKTFGIARTSADKAATAMTEVTQAMVAGRLEGLGLSNILKSSPAIAENIQKYLEDIMNIDASNISRLATEGVLTADVIKNAMFYAAEETNVAFASMPATWGGLWQNIKTGALEAFSPVLLKINEVANNERIKQMMDRIGEALQFVAGVAMILMDFLIASGNFIYDNWHRLEPIIVAGTIALGAYLAILIWTNRELFIAAFMTATAAIRNLWYIATTVIATFATHGFTGAMLALSLAIAANPIGWLIGAIVALILIFYLAVAAVNYFTGESYSATGLIVGAFAVAGAFIMNVLFGIAEIAFGVIEGLYNHWMAFANFFANVFNDPVGAIIHLFGDFGDNILGVIEKIAAALDFVFGTNFASTVAGWRNGLANLTNWAAEEYGNGNYEKLYDELDINKTLEEMGLKVERFNYGDTWDSSYNWGANLFKSKDKEKDNSVEEAINNALAFGENNALALDDTMNKGNEHSKQIADNTGSMANGVTLMNDELKYMRDLAEREAINRYTTAEVIVDARSENHINSELDIDGVIDRFGEKVEEVAVGLAEGGGVSFV
ncbi:tape measure protein [Metasolibacillus meyeri]|uniref:Tape measure protein n=1 Tax=Metasolibacillus meyeri TaxID=1071052 RepID=A0AAW9NV21_9BACL|nr:tape measure protein [Metasolibacillus meyeri]MEC1180351.1 tape measure protein [Metasolibacillus meyeri]